MKYRALGASGLRVSALGLGCMGMSMAYGAASDQESIETIQSAIDAGVTLIDTADMYGWGHNESLIGRAIKGRRDQLVIATKMAFVQDGDGFSINASPNYIQQACEASLKRLNVEAIDLYYLHRVDPATPIEESMQALARLVQQGKIRHIGLSEVTSATIRRATHIHPIAAIQSEYSLWQRQPEHDILATCRELSIGFVPYSPLGRGFLSGAIDDVNTLAKDDFRRVLPRYQGECFSENKKLLAGLTAIGHDSRCTTAQVALAWLLAQGDDIVPIPGTKRVSYLHENLAAVDLVLSATEIKALDQLFHHQAVKGDKYPAHLDFER